MSAQGESAHGAAASAAAEGATWHVVELDAIAATPWRNGFGRTRELLAWPPGCDADGWAVRVSVADVEADGPFSSFPGIDRAFAVLQGDGVQLDIDGATTQLRAGDEPLVFAGESSVQARLIGGATRDLNLMVRRKAFTAKLQRLGAGMAWQPGARLAGVYTHHAARCRLQVGEFDLPARSLLWFDSAPAALTLRPSASGQPFDALAFACTPRAHP